MKKNILLLVAIVTLAFVLALPVFAQPLAFPTAEGFGRFAKGGRGGAVILVTNLQDAGPGSLRACVEASGPRTCVPTVSGEIRVNSRITCSSPYLTVAGQAAPGDGLMVTNRGGSNLDGPLRLAPACHDAIIRHIRIRPGPPPVKSTNVSALQIEASRVIVDHVSLSWSNDQTLNVLGNGGVSAGGPSPTAGDVTIQDSFVFEPLNNANHTKGIHAFPTFLSAGVEDLSIIRTAFAHSEQRAPLLEPAGHIEWVNALVYNNRNPHGELYTKHGRPYFNITGSLNIRGPNSLANSGAAFDVFQNGGLSDGAIFIGGAGWPGNLAANAVLDPKDSASPAPAGLGLSVPQASVLPPLDAYSAVLARAGALPRDAVDARVVAEIRACTGAIKTPAGIVFPTLASAPAPADADQDGMADAWETANGLNPSNAADRNGDLDADGFTNLEDYLNGLADGLAAAMPAVPVPASLPCGTGGLMASPVINTFAVSKTAALPGEPVTITWSASGASSCRAWNSGGISGFNGSIACTGSTTISFPVSEEYELDFSATNGGYTEIKERILYVSPSGSVPAPDVTLTASDTAIDAGELVTFTWAEAAGVRKLRSAECVASSPDPFWSGFKAVTGAQTFPPSASGVYEIACTGPGGSDSASVTLTVNGAPPPPPPAPPVISVSAPSLVIEGTNTGGACAAPYTDVVITFTRTGDLSGASSVAFSTAPGAAPAVSGNDLCPGFINNAPVNFASGESVKTEVRRVRRESAVEPTENLLITLSAPVGATLGAASTTVEIVNDDAPLAALTSGAPIVTTRADSVRGAAGGVVIGRQPLGARGVITGDRFRQDGQTWWPVDFDADPDGWMRQVSLKVMP